METSCHDSGDNGVLTQVWFVLVTNRGAARRFALMGGGILVVWLREDSLHIQL